MNYEYSILEEKCNIYYKTCGYENRLCIDTDYIQVCECQAGYYSLGFYNNECSSIFEKQ